MKNNLPECFINLTNGIEALSIYFINTFQFIRIQSTYLERGFLEKVLQDLDNNFLMKLALGKKCIVFDFSSRRCKKREGVSRSCWQGLSWIEYCLNRIWFGEETEYKWGMHHHFKEQYSKLSNPTKNKLKYYKKFLMTDKINLKYISKKTTHDSDVEFYKKVLEEYMK